MRSGCHHNNLLCLHFHLRGPSIHHSIVRSVQSLPLPPTATQVTVHLRVRKAKDKRSPAVVSYWNSDKCKVNRRVKRKNFKAHTNWLIFDGSMVYHDVRFPLRNL